MYKLKLMHDTFNCYINKEYNNQLQNLFNKILFTSKFLGFKNKVFIVPSKSLSFFNKNYLENMCRIEIQNKIANNDPTIQMFIIEISNTLDKKCIFHIKNFLINDNCLYFKNENEFIYALNSIYNQIIYYK